MITCFLKEKERNQYFVSQKSYLQKAIAALDDFWIHSGMIKTWCTEGIEQIDKFAALHRVNLTEWGEGEISEKTKKYTQWAETMRLAFFQYSRFTEKKYARSEALYSTLVSLAATWHQGMPEKIIIPGCGPGRSVLDFARIYKNSQVEGLDYSFLALLLADRIVCSDKRTALLRRDVYSEDDISAKYLVEGFSLSNAEFGISNLITCEIPECDLLVCSNTVNLLPNHEAAVRKIADAVRSDGTVIFADLIGWRLDRPQAQRRLNSDASMKELFEMFGFQTLDLFSGVPYIEAESDDQETCYKEHFYVGRKR